MDHMDTATPEPVVAPILEDYAELPPPEWPVAERVQATEPPSPRSNRGIYAFAIVMLAIAIGFAIYIVTSDHGAPVHTGESATSVTTRVITPNYADLTDEQIAQTAVDITMTPAKRQTVCNALDSMPSATARAAFITAFVSKDDSPNAEHIASLAWEYLLGTLPC